MIIFKISFRDLVWTRNLCCVSDCCFVCNCLKLRSEIPRVDAPLGWTAGYSSQRTVPQIEEKAAKKEDFQSYFF